MSFLKKFPSKDELLESYKPGNDHPFLKVNNHIHTPYSFSAFQSVKEAIEIALKEKVKILGINDFYVADGYEEFLETCLSNGIFPLLNLEMIGISKSDQERGIRINDPKNPGRIYVSGKGFAFPFELPAAHASVMDTIIDGSNKQVGKMISLLNQWMKKQDVDMELSVKEIREIYAMRLLRERHVARRLRLQLDFIHDDEAYTQTLTKLYGGEAPQKSRSDIAGMEDELRSRLLKTGTPGFVPENEEAFLPLDKIMEIIRSAGGVPCYPMLLDGAGEEMTEFEKSKDGLKKELDRHGFTAVELIPPRNDHAVLKAYASYFYAEGFVVSFGTEHNTSALTPLTVTAKGGQELDDELMQISYNGAAWQAAHQYLLAKEGQDDGRMSRDEMETLGKAVFEYYFNRFAAGK